MVSAKCSFANIILMHQNLVVALEKVQLGKPTSTTQLIQELVNGWNRKMIFDFYRIQRVIVHTKSPHVVMFFY